MSLVIELQQLAWDQKNDLSDLLRKAYAVAFKLNLRGFKTWTECEMNGYMNKKMPPYRQIQGRVVCHNPYHGWIPFICSGDPQLQTTLSSRWLNTPVGVLQEFLQHNNDGNSIINYPPDIENRLMRGMDIPLRPALEVPRSAYVAILDKVRNTILNWRALIRNSASASKSLDLRRSHKDLRRENRFTYQSPTGAYGWKRMAFSVTA